MEQFKFNSEADQTNSLFPLKWPFVLALVVLVASTPFLKWYWPVEPQAPFVGLTGFRVSLAVMQVICALYMVAYIVPGHWSFTPAPAFRFPIQAFAWIAPSVIALYFASLAKLANSGVVALGMFGLLIAILIVVPLAFFWAGFLFIGVMHQLVKPIWWVLGKPETRPAGTTTSNVGQTVAAPAFLPRSNSPESVGEDKKHQYEFDWREPKTKFSDLAGMHNLKAELSSAIAPFANYASRGEIADRNGVLLSGPPGNGKSAFALAMAGELGLRFVKVSGVDICTKWVNESPQVLKSLFEQAAEAPSVIFFEEFDSIGKDRSGEQSEEDRKVVTALLPLLDDARARHIVIVAATNYIDLLDKALIREGRFDYRIEVPYPDLEARVGILNGMLQKFKVTAEPTTVNYVAELWERRSVAFIESVVKRVRDAGHGHGAAVATVEAFKNASRAASRRSGNIPGAGVKLSALALTASVKREAASLVYRLRNWEKIAEQGGEPPSGVLLYGPPGTGKTNLVRALARELEYWHVFEVNATEVLRDPRKFTDIVQLAADHRPAIIFIDEADELLRVRAQSNSAGATNEILKAMDGMMGKVPEVVFMAATNSPEAIDAAALRGGRFAEKIFMGRLSGDDLIAFLEKDFETKSKVRFSSEVTPQSLSERLGEASPADALAVLKKAINYTFEADTGSRCVTMVDIEAAIESIQS